MMSMAKTFQSLEKVSNKVEKRKAPAYRRQAQDEPAERLFFNLLDGLACDLEPMAPGAGQITKSKLYTFFSFEVGKQLSFESCFLFLAITYHPQHMGHVHNQVNPRNLS